MKTKKGSESDNKKRKDRCRDSMEVVLTNGVGYFALVKESFHRNSRKDEEEMYIRTEILSPND